jgi:cell division septal protein FtsQ
MNKRLGANGLKKRRESRSAATIKRKGRKVISFVRVFMTVALVCGGAVFGAVRLWEWLQSSPRLTIRSIEIRGNVRTDREEIRRLSRLKEGMRMLDVKPALAEKSIAANAWIRQAHVSRRFPDKVVVSVEERTPIALVNVGRIHYIDDEGVVLPLFPATYSDLPLVSGVDDSAGSRISKASLKRILSLLSGAGGVNASLIKHISQIDFSNGTTARIKLENSPLLVEIDDRNCTVQWKRFQELWEVFKNNPEGMPQSINLCYKNLAVAQW